MQVSRRTVCAMGVVSLVMGPAAFAEGGPVLLTVSGNIADGPVHLTRADLRALDWRDITTFTSFTQGPQRFGGPTLASVLRAVDARGAQIHATAINDYTVSFPLSDARDFDVLLALDHNGRAMRVRDKGPIWVVYPLSQDAAARQIRDAQMIWQLDRLSVA